MTYSNAQGERPGRKRVRLGARFVLGSEDVDHLVAEAAERLEGLFTESRLADNGDSHLGRLPLSHRLRYRLPDFFNAATTAERVFQAASGCRRQSIPGALAPGARVSP